MSGNRPPRPDPLDFRPDAVPEDLREREQWVAWRYQWDSDRDEWTKVPVDVNTGGFAKSTDADTWTSFEDAVAHHTDSGADTDGVGFVVHDDDLLVGIDLDDCRNTDTGDLEPWAEDLVADVPTYAEVSPSGTGLRLFGYGFVPDGGTRADVDGADGHLEMYETGRYLTVTGHHIEDTPADVRQVKDEVAEVHAEHIAEDDETPKAIANGDVKADSPGVNLSDDEILEKAKDADNGDKFRRLWNGDTSGYPSHSEARLALAGILAFWTGGDEQQMLRLFRSSDLYRDEDDERTFTNYEIPTALAGRTDFYDPEKSGQSPANPRPDGGSAAATPTPEAGETHFRERGSPQWSGVYEQYANASDADERKPARFNAAELLSGEFHWANLEENDVLYAYDDGLGIYNPTGEQKVRQLLVDNLREEYAKNEKSEILDQLRGRHTVSQEDMGGPENHVPVRNGVLEVTRRGIEVKDHNPEYRFLGSVATEYDPEAECPRFEEFLSDVVRTEAGRKKLQEYAGYTLMHWGLPYHKALFLVGPTASGKSTFLDTIRATLGEDAVVSLTPQELTSQRFAGAELFQSWANFRNDIPSSLIENTGAFKEIVAGDSIKAEQKFKDPFRFEPNAKHLFSANQLPDAETEDEAFYRRVLLVPFPSTVPREKRDPHLDVKLQSELSGVLNWMLDGLQRLMQQGQFTADRTPGETQRTWEKWGNTVDRFREICLTKDESEDLPKQTAYQAYHAYCEAENLPAETQHKMTSRLKEEGIADGRATINGKQRRVFVGVTFTEKGESYLPDESDGEQERF